MLSCAGRRAKANLDEERITPGSQVPDTKYGEPLSKLAMAGEVLAHHATFPQAFAGALADIKTHHSAAVTELKERLTKAWGVQKSQPTGVDKSRLQYSIEILEAASLGH